MAMTGAFVDDLDVRLAGCPLLNEDMSRFSITRKLADTLQGRIWLALDNDTRRECVVKQASRSLIIRGVSRTGARVPENFPREVRVHAALSMRADCNVGVVKCIAWWLDENFAYLAIEKCAGELFEFIQRQGQSGNLSTDIATSSRLRQRLRTAHTATPWIVHVKGVFKSLVGAVCFIHDSGVAHLDLSLENTMLATPSGVQAKIIDFGLAKQYADGDFTDQGSVGKGGYMAPEVVAGKRYDARAADIWCLGVMLFMMLVGAPPFPRAVAATRGGRATTYDYIIRGQMAKVLQQWRRIPLLTENALNLLNLIFRLQTDRIDMDALLRHPFVGLVAVADARGEDDEDGGAGEGLAAGDGDDDADDAHMREVRDREEGEVDADGDHVMIHREEDEGGADDDEHETKDVVGEAAAVPLVVGETPLDSEMGEAGSGALPERRDSRSVRIEIEEASASASETQTIPYTTVDAKTFQNKLNKQIADGGNQSMLRQLLDDVIAKIHEKESPPVACGSEKCIEELHCIEREITETIDAQAKREVSFSGEA